MALGLLLVFNVISIPLGAKPAATITYPPYFWYHSYPSGVDPTNPTMMSSGSTVTLDMEVVYYDATARVELPSPAYWVTVCSVTKTLDGSAVQTVSMGLPTSFPSGVQVGNDLCSVSVWQRSWNVPNTNGVTYTFTWSVDVKDASGLDYGTQTLVTYGKTPLSEPDGMFKINGKDASQTSALVVLSPTLDLSFVPSKNPEKITSVTVKVTKGSALLTSFSLTKQSDGAYTGSFTLPGYGTYELDGYVNWSGGNPLQKMSLVANWESPGATLQSWLGLNQIGGYISLAVGAVLTVTSREKPKKKTK